MGFTVAGFLALTTFCLSVVFAVLAMIDWKECHFDTNPDVFLHADKYEREQDEMYKTLAKDTWQNFEENEGILDSTKLFLRLSLCSACAQVPAWVLLI